MTQNRHKSTPLPSILLNAIEFNWVEWLKQLCSTSESKFGLIGQDIISGVRSVLPIKPNESDVLPSGTDRYPFDENDELTQRGERMLDADIKRFDKALEIQIADDTAAYTEIRETTSTRSIALVVSSPGYALFKTEHFGQRATHFLHLLKLIHSAADAKTVFNRTLQYFNSSFDSDIGTTLNNIHLGHLQLLSDLGPPIDPTRPHLIDSRAIETLQINKVISTIPSLALFLEQQLLQPIDSSNPQLLASKIIAYDLARQNQYHTDSPSTQGQAYNVFPSSTTPPPSPNTGSTIPLKSSKPHCVHCFKATGQKFNRHGVPGTPPCHRVA
jgi:hypothetical protein